MAVATTDRRVSRPLAGLEAGHRRYREKFIVGGLFLCAASRSS